MTTTTLSQHAAGATWGGHGFGAVARMEWHKLRTVRSTWSLVAAFVVGMIGMAMLVLSHENYTRMSPADRVSFDPTHDTFIGLVLGQLLFGVLGALAITAEFSCGTIRATFAAAPRRPAVLAAKATVLAAVTLAAGEVTAFAAFLAGRAVLPAPTPDVGLGQPGVLRVVLMAGAYPALIALVGLGLGAIIRHTAGAICAVVGVLFALPLLAVPLSSSIQRQAQNFLPHPMVATSLTAVKPAAHTMPPGLGFGVLCAYAVAALAAGAWALARRDV